MKTTTIYITANFCGCLFCKGSYKITNRPRKGAFLAASQGEFKTYLTGGRNSVHGCWKIKANQEFRLFLRPEFYDTEVKTINTRGD